MIQLLPTAYLPPVSYLASCASADRILLEACETYPKQTIRNRCTIMGPNGRQILTVPVSKPNGNRTKTKEIRISDHQSWQQHHWRSIQTAYNRSPFLLYYETCFLPMYERPFSWLMDFNDTGLEILMMILRIDTEWQRTAEYIRDPVGISDHRTQYTHSDHFNQFLSFPAYHQVFSSRFGFQENLSIIDLICNIGPDAGEYVRQLTENNPG